MKRSTAQNHQTTEGFLTFVRLYVWAFLLAVVVVVSSARGSDDALGAYLERLELHDLLIVHLEEQLSQATDEQRESIILDLADLYMTLLASEDDDDRRAAIEARSRALLERAPADSAAALRLTLLRNVFTRAERVAEDHRLRLADDEAVQNAEEQFGELIRELDELEAMVDRRLSRLERRGGREDEWARRRLAELEHLRMQSLFYKGWATYYAAFLRSDREVADRAERIFARLLRTESEYPHPREVSIDLREQEAYARAILGMALCRSMTASYATAAEWLDLLEHRSTHRAVRMEATGWRLVIALEHEEFRRARDILADRDASEMDIPPAWLRLAAVSALEAEQRDRDVNELAVFALTRLASRGELAQVLALAEMHAIEAIGSDGFALHYIRGVKAYREARDAHNADGVAESESVREKYEHAASQLQQTLDARDVDDFAEAAASCRSMIGWSRFYLGEFVAAADWFERAHDGFRGERAEELLWMAIVSLDRSLRQRDDATLRERREALVQSYLAKHPGTSRAMQLHINRALDQQRLTERQIQELLAMPATDEAGLRARRVAAQGLYDLYREASGEDRARRGRAFLEVADRLFARADSLDQVTDEENAERTLLLARQVLEVALHRDVEERRMARRALDIIEAVEAHGAISLADVRDELAYRRLRLALLNHDRQQAAMHADALWSRDSQSIWARQAARTMFQDAHAQWQAATARANPDETVLAELLMQVAKYGGHVLREFEDDSAWVEQPHLVQAHVIVAEASLRLWEWRGQSMRGRAALFLYERLLEHQPRNATFLHSHARLAEHFEQHEAALQSWRTLAAGTQRGDPEWYEARYHIVRNLAEVNPARAREVLAQHRQLEPSYGPEPWGDMFEALADELNEGATGDEAFSS